MNEIKIGGSTYEVRYVTKVDGDSIGLIDYHECVIYIDESLGKSRMFETLTHEMLHGIFFEAGYEEHEEEIVNRLGKVLSQVLQDNFNLDNKVLNNME